MPKKKIEVELKKEEKKEEVREPPKQLLFSQDEMDKIFDPKIV